MNKIPCASQNMETKTLPTDVCVFIVLDGFHLLLSTQLIANLIPEWSGGSRFHSLSHIYTKNSFLLPWNSDKQHWIVDVLLFLIDCEQTQHPLWIQISHWQIYMQNGEYTAFWYLQLLTQLKFMIGRNEFMEFFKKFSGTTAEFGPPEHSVSFVSIQPYLKSAYHLLTIVSDGAESE